MRRMKAWHGFCCLLPSSQRNMTIVNVGETENLARPKSLLDNQAFTVSNQEFTVSVT